MNQKLRNKIDEFLRHRRRTDGGGGWAKIVDEDITQLEAIIKLLIESKCSPDADGDRPIEYMIVNRRTHNSVIYAALPYHTWQLADSDDLPPATEEEIMDTAMTNLGIATDDVTRLYRGLRQRELQQEPDQVKDLPEKPQEMDYEEA